MKAYAKKVANTLIAGLVIPAIAGLIYLIRVVLEGSY